jgi:hypothetical protein
MTAPAAELAHLDPVRRVSPGLVRLVIPSLAVFASQSHRNADISASHSFLFPLGRYKRKPRAQGAELTQG